MAAVLSYADWGYELPKLNHTSPDPQAVDMPVAIGESDGSFPELRLYGQKLSELGQIGTVPTLRHFPFEPTILEDPRNVIEGSRTYFLFGPANATVRQTPMQAALDTVYHTARTNIIENVGKPVSAVVMDRLQDVTSALAQTQSQAAQLTSTLAESTNTLAQRTGIATIDNAIVATMAPTIAVAETNSQDFQHSFTNMNHYVGQAGQQMLGTLQGGLAPLASVAEAVTAPVQRAVQVATGTAANVQYSFDAANLAILSPVASMASAMVQPAAAITRAALAPVASAALATADAISHAEVRTASNFAAQTLAPLRARVVEATNQAANQPLTGMFRPVIATAANGAARTAQPLVDAAGQGIAQSLASSIMNPRRNLLQLEELLPSPEDLELPVPEIFVNNPRESRNGAAGHQGQAATTEASTTDVRSSSPRIPQPEAGGIADLIPEINFNDGPSTTTSSSPSLPSRSHSAQATLASLLGNGDQSDQSLRLFYAQKDTPKASETHHGPLDELAMALAADPVGPLDMKHFQELTGQILDAPETPENPDLVAQLPSMSLPSSAASSAARQLPRPGGMNEFPLELPNINVVDAPASHQAAATSEAASDEEANPGSEASAESGDPLEELMQGPISINDADATPSTAAAHTEAATAAAGSTSTASSQKATSVKATGPTDAPKSAAATATPSAAKTASRPASMSILNFFGDLLPDFGSDDGPFPAKASPKPAATATAAASQTAISATPLEAKPASTSKSQTAISATPLEAKPASTSKSSQISIPLDGTDIFKNLPATVTFPVGSLLPPRGNSSASTTVQAQLGATSQTSSSATTPSASTSATLISDARHLRSNGTSVGKASKGPSSVGAMVPAAARPASLTGAEEPAAAVPTAKSGLPAGATTQKPVVDGPHVSPQLQALQAIEDQALAAKPTAATNKELQKGPTAASPVFMLGTLPLTPVNVPTPATASVPQPSPVRPAVEINPATAALPSQPTVTEKITMDASKTAPGMTQTADVTMMRNAQMAQLQKLEHGGAIQSPAPGQLSGPIQLGDKTNTHDTPAPVVPNQESHEAAARVAKQTYLSKQDILDRVAALRSSATGKSADLAHAPLGQAAPSSESASVVAKVAEANRMSQQDVLSRLMAVRDGASHKTLVMGPTAAVPAAQPAGMQKSVDTTHPHADSMAPSPATARKQESSAPKAITAIPSLAQLPQPQPSVTIAKLPSTAGAPAGTNPAALVFPGAPSGMMGLTLPAASHSQALAPTAALTAGASAQSSMPATLPVASHSQALSPTAAHTAGASAHSPMPGVPDGAAAMVVQPQSTGGGASQAFGPHTLLAVSPVRLSPTGAPMLAHPLFPGVTVPMASNVAAAPTVSQGPVVQVSKLEAVSVAHQQAVAQAKAMQDAYAQKVRLSKVLAPAAAPTGAATVVYAQTPSISKSLSHAGMLQSFYVETVLKETPAMGQEQVVDSLEADLQYEDPAAPSSAPLPAADPDDVLLPISAASPMMAEEVDAQDESFDYLNLDQQLEKAEEAAQTYSSQAEEAWSTHAAFPSGSSRSL
eukprot:jgi/Botrbrau1/8367/Bobra.0046s0027.2